MFEQPSCECMKSFPEAGPYRVRTHTSRQSSRRCLISATRHPAASTLFLLTFGETFSRNLLGYRGTSLLRNGTP